MTIIYIGIGGFIGSCLRYLITKLLLTNTTTFPFGTLISNVLAGFIIGFIFLYKEKIGLSPKINLFLTTGLLGGLSTFSTFSLETDKFIIEKSYFLAVSNIFLNLSLSLIAVAFGMFIGSMFLVKNN